MRELQKIDINADLGEGKGNDDRLMPWLNSCSIACGGHYGNEESMVTAVRLAKKFHVKVGAHPSFPDRDNFGRTIMTLSKSELTESIFHQLLCFYAVCEMEEVVVHHVKLHGALYNYAAKDAPTADAVVEAIIATKIRPKLYLPYGSILHKKAENLLPLVFEAFIDRSYNDDHSLVSRERLDSVIVDPEKAWKQFFQMIEKQSVQSINDKTLPVQAGTYCIHGDNPNAVEIVEHIRTQLQKEFVVTS